jgi:hypothetical protein
VVIVVLPVVGYCVVEVDCETVWLLQAINGKIIIKENVITHLRKILITPLYPNSLKCSIGEILNRMDVCSKD